MQRGIFRDPQMVEMLRDGPHDPNLVRSWMRDYGLFQGITNPDRTAIVARFMRFAAAHQRVGDITEDDIRRLYTELLTALHQTVRRSWVSAASKLLWCLYPSTVVIYDAFVHRALAVMQCIDDELAGFPRIGASPSIDGEGDIEAAVGHYMNYHAMVRRLQTLHSKLLQDLRTRHCEAYPYDVRIIDKLLWMIGNFREAY
ncbi:hypothetical protein [Solimonas marina]|uniref:Uncharacterized protein n=1 Tax=Solimonas marina TaxID=2714601 RepID=A0A969WAZ4_9GAMM|nr:hypothetical protein [Solimonas marina]NKF23189.1 hypothetical protein [Solimonas marina]